MTDREIKAIETMKNWIDYEKENKDKINKAEDLIDIQETIIKLIQKQQDKIDILHATLAENVTRTVCSDIKQSEKHKEDLEMLYKGCQLENEELKETMYKMASFIASQDIEYDICEKTGKLDTCDSMAYGECENCIINYFKNGGK